LIFTSPTVKRLRSMAEELPHPDHFHISAAQGWLGLGNPAEALVELDHIRAESQENVGVLELRFMASAQAKRFDEALTVAGRQIAAHPAEAQGWINRGNVLFWLARYPEAHQSVVSVLDQFPDQWTLRYNLACYCIKLERLAEAKEWYEDAAKTADLAELSVLALNDPDMVELKDWVRKRSLKKSAK
jgi:predicted Zn-dependent protease